MKGGLIFVFLFFCYTLSAQERTNTLQLYNINVVDISGGSVKTNQSVIVENGKIKTVEPFKSIDRSVAASQRIDGKDKFLIPGLWDMHIHLEGAELIEDNKALLPVFLAYGITSVRDCARILENKFLVGERKLKMV